MANATANKGPGPQDVPAAPGLSEQELLANLPQGEQLRRMVVEGGPQPAKGAAKRGQTEQVFASLWATQEEDSGEMGQTINVHCKQQDDHYRQPEQVLIDFAFNVDTAAECADQPAGIEHFCTGNGEGRTFRIDSIPCIVDTGARVNPHLLVSAHFLRTMWPHEEILNWLKPPDDDGGMRSAGGFH